MSKKSFYIKYGKRFFDLIFSLFVLLITLPLILVITILIKLSDSGSIIFKQKRVGRNGKVFTMFKFRTMVKDAEKLQPQYLHLNQADGPVFKIKNDPRFINQLTRFLARSGLDELPNILNILTNDISWVGPRPLPVTEAKSVPAKFRKIREKIKPGVTSAWVTKGAHNLSFTKWMELDLAYIENINFLTDLKIIVLTTKMVFKLMFKKLLKL